MEPQKSLENQFKKQNFDTEKQRIELLSQHIETLKSFVRIDRSVAVLSDLAANQSHIFIGNFGSFFNMKAIEYKKIDSIWEEEIYNKIHPDDLFDRHLLELEFFNFLSTIPPENRLNFSTECKIRAKNASNQYQTITHKTLYLASSSNGDVWLAVCLYNYSTDDTPFSTINGKIINNKTGEIRKVKAYKNCSNLLSKREIEMLHCVEQGLLSKEIAAKFDRSIYTINRHRQNILKKLNVNNSIEAVKTAKALGIL